MKNKNRFKFVTIYVHTEEVSLKSPDLGTLAGAKDEQS